MKYTVVLILVCLLTNTWHDVMSQDSLSTESMTATEEEEFNDNYQAVEPKDLTTTNEYKSDKIEVRKFDEEKWKKVIGSTDYNESHSKRKAQESGENGNGTGKGKGKRYRGSDDDDDEEEDDSDDGFNVSIGPLGGLLLQVIFYGLIIVIIGLILYNIVKNTSLKTRLKKPLDGLPDFSTQVEDIADLNIDELLEKALASGNYRLTIRIYFLGLLKKLNEGGLIAWKKDKTNRDYLTELYSQAEYFTPVRKLTLAYEQVWYGDHAISNGLFQELSEEFKAIDQKLNTAKVN